MAEPFHSGFGAAHDTYNGISCVALPPPGGEREAGAAATAAAVAAVYYVLCSEDPAVAGQVFRFTPAAAAPAAAGALGAPRPAAPPAGVLDRAPAQAAASSDGRIAWVGDLDQACGNLAAAHPPPIAQGKTHCPFVQSPCGRFLYTATHVGFYSTVDGMEVFPDPPPAGRGPYGGGRFLRLDLRGGGWEDLSGPIAVLGGSQPEGVLAFTADAQRGALYGITWPRGHFISLQLKRGGGDGGDGGGGGGGGGAGRSGVKAAVTDHGPVSHGGESVHPRTGRYRALCRSLAVDPRDGDVYFSTAEGHLRRYSARRRRLLPLPAAEPGDTPPLKLDYFGQGYDVASAGTMAWNWRQVVWVPAQGCFFGVHGNSGYLFAFAPVPDDDAGGRAPATEAELARCAGQVRVLERLTSLPSRRAGVSDLFTYGYLGFSLGPDGRTLYYLTGGPRYREQRRVRGVEHIPAGASRGEENLHLVTYDIPTQHVIDHGAIHLARKPGVCRGAGDGGGGEDGADGEAVVPSYVNSIAVGPDGAVYSLGRIHSDDEGHAERHGRPWRTDLFRIAAKDIRLVQE